MDKGGYVACVLFPLAIEYAHSCHGVCDKYTTFLKCSRLACSLSWEFSLAPILRIRNYGETESMRRQCAIFVAEISLAEGMAEQIDELDTPKLKQGLGIHGS